MTEQEILKAASVIYNQRSLAARKAKFGSDEKFKEFMRSIAKLPRKRKAKNT